MPNSIAYLLNNNKKSDRTVHDGGASLVFTWSAAGGWCCYRYQQPPRPRHDQPTPTHCIDALYTINVLCLIKDSNELITME